ncbi:hypothetical protein LCGC14_2917500, partial [marine sediment metagenome]
IELPPFLDRNHPDCVVKKPKVEPETETDGDRG